MNKIFTILCFFFSTVFAIGQSTKTSSINTPKTAFKRGEYLEYKANFGIFTVGKGTFYIQPTLHKIKDIVCYKLDAHAKTKGIFDWLGSVNDHWGAYIDTTSLLTHISYRALMEGKYRKNEVAYFDFKEKVIRVKDYDFTTNEYKDPEKFKMEKLSREMMSGLLYIRTLDFSTLSKGDTIKIYSFLENTFYEFEIIVAGREKIKIKAGEFKSIKLIPIMPKNTVFEGKKSITAWFSDDKNKIPLKIEAKMFIGYAGIELSKYKNLKNHHPSLSK